MKGLSGLMRPIEPFCSSQYSYELSGTGKEFTEYSGLEFCIVPFPPRQPAIRHAIIPAITNGNHYCPVKMRIDSIG